MPRWNEARSISEATWNAREERIAELEAALRAIMDAHGPGTLASEAIYEQAVTALNGPRPVER